MPICPSPPRCPPALCGPGARRRQLAPPRCPGLLPAAGATWLAPERRKEPFALQLTPASPLSSGAPARVQAPGRTAARRPGSLLWSGARGSCSRAHSTTASLPPTPVVTIDNLSDPLATIVEISYGDLLGELLDTVRRCGTRTTRWRTPRECFYDAPLRRRCCACCRAAPVRGAGRS